MNGEKVRHCWRRGISLFGKGVRVGTGLGKIVTSVPTGLPTSQGHPDTSQEQTISVSSRPKCHWKKNPNSSCGLTSWESRAPAASSSPSVIPQPLSSLWRCHLHSCFKALHLLFLRRSFPRHQMLASLNLGLRSNDISAVTSSWATLPTVLPSKAVATGPCDCWVLEMWLELQRD